MVIINKSTSIPEEELQFSASRSSGPGGQNVNKVNTRITLSFDLEGSPSLTREQKDLIARRLDSRMNKEGMLLIHCQTSRSQWANKMEAMDRFVALLQSALKTDPPRKRTRIPSSVRKKRLSDKKLKGRLKKNRSWKHGGDGAD